MITYDSNWETVKKIGKYTVRRQWIGPHDRYLHAVYSVKTYRRNVDSSPDDTVERFTQDVSWWTQEECERWVKAQR